MNTTTDNAPLIVARLLKELDIRVSDITVEETLKRHPDFPSLSSLSDALTIWSVEHAPLRLSTIEQLRDLPLPFVAHLRQQGGWFRLITDVQDDSVVYWDSITGRGRQSLAQFKQVWDGIVLIAERKEESGKQELDINWQTHRRDKLRKPILYGTAFLSIGALVMLLHAYTLNIFQLSWGLTKVLGLCLSIALLAKQLGIQSNVVNQLCKIGSKTNCQSLLDSPGAKLWGWLSWAEVGTVYFATTLGTWLLSPTNLLISVLALFALPYILFSVYYQAKIAQIWCPLCLGVQGILLTEGLLSLASIFKLTHTNTIIVNDCLIFTIVGSVVLMSWLLIKPLLISSLKMSVEHDKVLSFKRDIKVFNTLLDNTKQMTALPKTLRPIWLGKNNAEYVLTFVTNPYCNHCAKKHQQVLDLMAKQQNIAVRIVFLVVNSREDRVMQMVGHLMALEHTQAVLSLNDWFDRKEHDYSAWSSKYPLSNGHLPNYDMAIQHAEWCNEAGIKFTPAIFLNEKKIPDQYDLDDLVWLVHN